LDLRTGVIGAPPPPPRSPRPPWPTSSVCPCVFFDFFFFFVFFFARFFLDNLEAWRDYPSPRLPVLVQEPPFQLPPSPWPEQSHFKNFFFYPCGSLQLHGRLSFTVRIARKISRGGLQDGDLPSLCGTFFFFFFLKFVPLRSLIPFSCSFLIGWSSGVPRNLFFPFWCAVGETNPESPFSWACCFARLLGSVDARFLPDFFFFFTTCIDVGSSQIITFSVI